MPLDDNRLSLFPVLVAEDNIVFQSMLRNLLTKWGYGVQIARDGEEAWRVLQTEGAPRLAILDWMMPGIDGVEICRRLRETPREPYVYVLLLTGRTESEDLVEGMDAGADDYLTKPFHAKELRVRLRAGRRILDLQEQLMLAREALRLQATHDCLTGLLNRGSVMEILQTEMERSERNHQPLGLLMVDLDRFKLINDTHGHPVGDTVLREAAHRMQASIRRYDAVGRYGGEEFLVVLPGCDLVNTRIQAERIRETIAAQVFEHSAGTLTVTCSIGATSSTMGPVADPVALIRQADLALYVAKDHGRNRVEVYLSTEETGDKNRDLTNLVSAVVT